MLEDRDNMQEAFHNPNRDQEKDYDETKMAKVLSEGEFTSWDEVLGWLRDFGAHDNELNPGKVKNMIDDLTRLKNSEINFTLDPEEATRLAKSTRE